MTWDEAQDDIRFNLTWVFTFIGGMFLALINGTMLKVFPELNFQQMDINDILAIILAVVGLVFTLLKSYHEVLKIIDKRQDMKQKKLIDEEIRQRTIEARIAKENNDNTKDTGTKKSSMEMDSKPD